MEYKNELNLFEQKLSEHCNHEYDKNTGEEIINTHLSTIMIAFEEYYKQRTSQNVSNNNDTLDALPIQHINSQICPYCGNEYFQPCDEVTGMQYCFACKKVF